MVSYAPATTMGPMGPLLATTRKFFSYDLGPITATNTRPHCGAFRPTPATDWQQVQVHLVSSQLRTANKSKCAWSQLSYGNGNKCAAVGPIRQPGGGPPLMNRLPLLHRLKRRNRRCLPLKPLHLHQHRLRRRRRRQPARPLVTGQHIGVPMLVQAVRLGGVEGVVHPKAENATMLMVDQGAGRESA